DDGCTRRLLPDEIEAALDSPGTRDDPRCVYYGLTAEGGRQWEAFAAPDWERFISWMNGTSRSGRFPLGTLMSPTSWRIEGLLEGAHHYGITVEPGSVRRRTLRPWRPTYWKELPAAHLIAYRYREVEYDFTQIPHGLITLNENRWYHWM